MSLKDDGGIGAYGVRRLVSLTDKVGRAGRWIDNGFRRWEQRHAHRALRYSLAFVFVWFGITKPLGISPAVQVVRPTLAHTPILSELVSFPTFFAFLGTWEALVGIGLLWRRTVRLAVACMCIQMATTFTPLFVIPAETFRWWPLVPSAPGFYIMKNFALATAGLVVASFGSEPLFGATRVRRLRPRFPESLVDGFRTRIERATGVRRDVFEPTALGRLAVGSLQMGLSVVFIWSGVLMVSSSPVPGQWVASVVPKTMMADAVFIPLLGVWELAIGLYLLLHKNRATHAAAYLCLGYVGVTMLPVVMHPTQVFASVPFEPTFEGVYLFKDLILVAGVLTVDAYRSDGRSGESGSDAFDWNSGTDAGPTGT